MQVIDEPKKRNVAYKLGIGDILKAKPILSEGKLLHVELGDKQIIRINLLANVIEKFISDNAEKKYASITLDDASGQIRLKSFGDDVKNFEKINQGDTLQVIGLLREYNSELYINPEIVKSVDPRWLLVRKLEMQKSRKLSPSSQATANIPIRDTILEKIKTAEKENGIDVDALIMLLDSPPDLINQEIKKLLEEGAIYEPRPGRLRYLGS